MTKGTQRESSLSRVSEKAPEIKSSQLQGDKGINLVMLSLMHMILSIEVNPSLIEDASELETMTS